MCKTKQNYLFVVPGNPVQVDPSIQNIANYTSLTTDSPVYSILELTDFQIQIEFSSVSGPIKKEYIFKWEIDLPDYRSFPSFANKYKVLLIRT